MNKCVVCGKETKNKKYCSVECKARAMSKPKARCLNCGKEVDRCEVKFCSRACYGEYKSKENAKKIVYNKCIICGKDTKNPKYCSMKCLGKDPSRHQISISNLKNTHIWSDEEINYLKENYGVININDLAKNLNLDKSAVIAYATKHNIKSQRRWKETEKKYLEEHSNDNIDDLCKEVYRSKFAIKNEYSRMNGFLDDKGKSIISPQEYVTNFIKSLEIPYLEELSIGRYKTDILIHNLDIEVQGTYWHCDKRFVDYNNLTDAQKKRIEKDKRKYEYLTSQNIKVLYLWEYDIVSNPKKCKQIILDKLKELNIYRGVPN